MRTGLMMKSLHQRHRFLRRRRRCLRRARCHRHLRGLWYHLALRRRRSGTIRMSRMSIAFQAVPRSTGNQEIGHLLVISAHRYHGDTSLAGCSSPLGCCRSVGCSHLSHLVCGLCSCVLILSHALVFVFFWFTLVVAAVPGGVQIRGSLSLVCKAAAAFSRKADEVLKFGFVLPRLMASGQSGCALLVVWMPMCTLASPWVAQACTVPQAGCSSAPVALRIRGLFSSSASRRVALAGPSAPLLCPCSVGSERRGPLCWRPGRVCCR